MAAVFSSSSLDREWVYDVFINFRGGDTRRNFVSHLCSALDQKGINVFTDDGDLRRGDKLSTLTAIEKSRISIVVFSENYASSTWCLKELVQILECMNTKEQMVVPIFYQVDPSDVRKLRKSFAEAFAQHEHDSEADMEEVRSWRSALARATNLSGWDSRRYQDDSKLIVEVTEFIFNKLVQVSTTQINGLVGMNSHIDKMKSLLCLGVDDVQVVGIWGMGGIGKTTIAKAVYNEIAHQFEACCFLENVNEGFRKHGAVHMQEILLSRIFKKTVQIISTWTGSEMMERLRYKKVLLVLDDVDSIDQIETLLGRQRSFGGGSRIIIISRDRHLLEKSGVDEIYAPKLLSYDEAIELFMQHAFRRNQPQGEYNHLLSPVVEYTQGLPLAVKVLGALLDGRSVCEWEAALEKFKEIPNNHILEALRTSFDDLASMEKEIFLDIACFFKGMNKYYAKKILDSCGFFPQIGLRVLVDRGLVTISDDGTLEMHDLLEQMGHEIVRQESIKEPGKRSRLWSYEDVRHVLTHNTGTPAVQSITLDLSNSRELCTINPAAFVHMNNLRLLKIKYPCHSVDYDGKAISCKELLFLSHKLSCLLWHGCPIKSFPSSFHPKHLVDLDLQYSHIEQLWAGPKPLEKLEFINLSHSQYLKEIPDLTMATNLEKLILDGCISLLKVHPSISFLKNLAFLSLRGCQKLENFPSPIFMKSLKTLNLSGCSKLEKFPEILDVMEKLTELYLGGTAIQELPPSIANLTGLVTLSLEECKELERLPSSISKLKSLAYLTVYGCTKLVEFQNS